MAYTTTGIATKRLLGSVFKNIKAQSKGYLLFSDFIYPGTNLVRFDVGADAHNPATPDDRQGVDFETVRWPWPCTGSES